MPRFFMLCVKVMEKICRNVLHVDSIFEGGYRLLTEATKQKPEKLNNPFFYKASSDAEKYLEQLQEFKETAPANVKTQVEQDIRMLSYGIAGEKNVAFELNNSHIPMLVLHDLHIEFEELTAQIDYLIITKKFVMIIECKNLIGNIEVRNNGEFIRTTEYKGRLKKEGIYSPVTQVTRHLELIRQARLSLRNNFITKALFEKMFYENYKTVVVLANPKTIVNMKYAKKEVKERIIRCDQLIEHIKKVGQEKAEIYKEKDMYELADYFLSLHTPTTVDYTKKYLTEESESSVAETPQMIDNIEETPLYKELKRYRLETSKAEDIKAYFIFNNLQMNDLINARPKTLDELNKIPGFGDVKCQKYGNAILEIIKKYS